MVKPTLLILFLALFLTMLPIQLVKAHGFGESLEKEVDGYNVNLGYDKIGNIVVGELVHIDFDIHKEKDDLVDFTSVWVRIAPERDIAFAAYIAPPEFGKTGMSYIFPSAGNYEITARFYRDSNILTETIFTITVDRDALSVRDLIVYAVFVIIGFVGGVTSVLIIKKKEMSA